MIAVFHAGLAAALYILLREHLPLPWLWPLDDAVSPVAAILIVTGWGWIARREPPLARGAIIGVVTGIVLATLLGALFAATLRYWLPRLSTSPAPLILFYGIGLAAWLFIAFLEMLATIAAGLIAGAVGHWRSATGRVCAGLLALCSLSVPLVATWSHMTLGIGLVDLDRCRERLEDSASLAKAIFAPRVIVTGIRADCWGQPVRGGMDSN